MKVFLDESGQTGCVIKNKEELNFINSPTFALSAIVVEDNQLEKLEKDYEKFKKLFSITGEIKGTDLLIKENNDKLNYFINNILTKTKIYINIYDKRFYLSTLILFSFCGFECLKDFKFDIYNQASILSRQDNMFFVKYLNFIEKPNKTSFSKYLDFLISYDYKYFKDINGNYIENVLIIIAKKIRMDKTELYFVNDFMTYGWYKDKKITNLINLNCFCELIYFTKKDINVDNSKIEFIHDTINEFEDTINDELSQHGIDIRFEDSNNSAALQIADNVVSIFRHSFDKAMEYCAKSKMWEKKSLWDLRLFSQLQQIIKTTHIKYTVSLPDWSASLCIRDMFSNDYQGKYRNNLYFNILYKKYLDMINIELINNSESLKDIEDILNN